MKHIPPPSRQVSNKQGRGLKVDMTGIILMYRYPNHTQQRRKMFIDTVVQIATRVVDDILLLPPILLFPIIIVIINNNNNKK